MCLRRSSHGDPWPSAVASVCFVLRTIMHSDTRWSSDLPSSLDAQPSLLLVDNDTDAAHTLSSILCQEHYTVEIVSRVDEATKKISKCSFDVVLIDLAMAEDDGLELLIEIR